LGGMIPNRQVTSFFRDVILIVKNLPIPPPCVSFPLSSAFQHCSLCTWLPVYLLSIYLLSSSVKTGQSARNNFSYSLTSGVFDHLRSEDLSGNELNPWMDSVCLKEVICHKTYFW
jgi:hypothetical protein